MLSYKEEAGAFRKFLSKNLYEGFASAQPAIEWASTARIKLYWAEARNLQKVVQSVSADIGAEIRQRITTICDDFGSWNSQFDVPPVEERRAALAEFLREKIIEELRSA